MDIDDEDAFGEFDESVAKRRDDAGHVPDRGLRVALGVALALGADSTARDALERTHAAAARARASAVEVAFVKRAAGDDGLRAFIDVPDAPTARPSTTAARLAAAAAGAAEARRLLGASAVDGLARSSAELSSDLLGASLQSALCHPAWRPSNARARAANVLPRPVPIASNLAAKRRKQQRQPLNARRPSPLPIPADPAAALTQPPARPSREMIEARASGILAEFERALPLF